MKSKTRQNAGGLIFFLGILFLMGTSGAVDQDSITLGQGIAQSVTALAMMLGGAALGGMMK